MAKAAHKCRLHYYINRIIAAPMEPRVALGTYDRAAESYTSDAALQNPHAVRDDLAAAPSTLDGNQLRRDRRPMSAARSA